MAERYISRENPINVYNDINITGIPKLSNFYVNAYRVGNIVSFTAANLYSSTSIPEWTLVGNTTGRAKPIINTNIFATNGCYLYFTSAGEIRTAGGSFVAKDNITFSGTYIAS